MWSRKVEWWLALKLIVRDQVLVGDDAIKSLDSWFFFKGVCFLFFLGKFWSELVVKRRIHYKLRETLAPSGLMGPKGATFFLSTSYWLFRISTHFSEFSLSTFGGFPHLGDFEGYDRKNRGAENLVHQFLMNSLIYITRIHHQYQKLCCEGNPKVYRGYEHILLDCDRHNFWYWWWIRVM